MLLNTYYTVIGNEATYRIALQLSRYALSVQEIALSLELPQPLVSHKLARLRKHSFASNNRVGKKVFYRFIEPWRSILLHSDIMWRKLNPEFKAENAQDQIRLMALIGDTLSEREIYPIITGPPEFSGDGQNHPSSVNAGLPGGHPNHS